MDVKVVACNGLTMNLRQHKRENNGEAGTKRESADFALILQKAIEKRRDINEQSIFC